MGEPIDYIYIGLADMLKNYEREHGQSPDVIALGKTHIEDLQIHLDAMPDGLYFEGIEIIQHNDPIGITMAHNNNQ